MAKSCTKCGGPGPFHKNKLSADGLHPWCKACRHASYLSRQSAAVKKARARYARNKKSVGAHEKTPERKAKRSANMARYRANNWTKEKSRQVLATEVRAGRVLRAPCVRCGAIKSHAHHKDYSKPLEVTWLCAKCHGKEHRLEVVDE